MQAVTQEQLIDQGYTELNQQYLINWYLLLGSGVFGNVYKGYDRQHQQFVAVKQINKQSNSPISPQMQMREIQVMQKLNHPNVMKFYGYQGKPNSPDGLFIFLEICEGGTLRDLINRQLTQKQAMSLFEQLIEGMAYIHEQSIFHRDLKPDNILITARGELKIADFGTARNIDTVKMTFKRCTPAYSAPQVYLEDQYGSMGGKYTQKCDVFSAGYILYEMLTSQQLNKAVSTHEGLRKFLRSCKQQGGFELEHPSLTNRWKELVSAMLSFSPDQRPSFSILCKALKGFAQGAEYKSQLRPRQPQEEKRSREVVQLFKRVVQKQIGVANYLVNPLRALQAAQNQKSKLVPKVYKLSLMYYSLLMYYKRAQNGIMLIGSKENMFLPGYDKVPFGELEFGLTVEDKKQVSQFAGELRKKINLGKEQIKDFLKAKIFPELEAILKQDQTNLQRIILQQIHITQKSLDQFRKYQRLDLETTCAGYFKRLVSNLYQTTAQLQMLSQTDLKMYLVLLYTSQLGKYGQGDLPPSHQAIMKMDREGLLKNIAAIKDQ